MYHYFFTAWIHKGKDGMVSAWSTTVRPNKKETGIVSYFSEKREQFMVDDIYHFKVQLFFFILIPFMTRKSHA